MRHDYNLPPGVSSETRPVVAGNNLNYEAALDWFARGYNVVPQKSATDKHPAVPWKALQSSRVTDGELRLWKPWFAGGVGFITGEISDIVVVETDGPKGEALLRAFEALHGELPPTRRVRSGSGRGVHYHFRHPGGYVKTVANPSIELDVKGDKGFCVLPPSLHKSGRCYELIDDVEPAPLPTGLLEFIAAKAAEAKGSAKATQGRAELPPRPAGSTVTPRNADKWILPASLPLYNPAEAERLRSALVFLFDERGLVRMNDREDWLHLGMVLHHLCKVGGWPRDLCRRIWDALSQSAPEKFDPEDQEKTWVSLDERGYGERPVTVLSLYKLARDNGWDYRPNIINDLIEAAKSDPGAAFKPESVQALVELKADDLAAFMRVRDDLKKAGCAIGALDAAIKKEIGEEGGSRPPSQAAILSKIVGTAELFHADKVAYADVIVNEHRETLAVKLGPFRHWLSHAFYKETGGALSSEALQGAIATAEARAIYSGVERPVFVRVGEAEGRLYLDLGDETWRAAEIDAAGWRIVDRPPVRFRRSSGMRALPEPERGGSVEDLRAFLNVQSDGDFVLAMAWQLACFRPRGPYPVLALAGEQGSAKSTFSRLMRSLIDPNSTPLRALPREARDLFIAAQNGCLLAFDNVSGLPAWLSNTLCRLATGGGFATRALYSDGDEVLFDAARPILLNGIDDIIARNDLADRALFLTLEPIPEDRRRPEQELLAAFEAVRPRILGGLLDAVSRGLAELPRVKLARLPRMADFALWAQACEPALWPAGTFVAAYCKNSASAVEGVLGADPVAVALRDMVEQGPGKVGAVTGWQADGSWEGTASELLALLNIRSRGWPTDPTRLANRIRRAATFLRKVGVGVNFDRSGHKWSRTIRIARAP